MELYLRSLDATPNTDYSLWKATKQLKNPITHRSPIKKPDGSWAKSDEEKAKIFAHHLTGVFTANDDNGSTKIDEIQSVLDQPHQMELPIKKFTKREILNAIKRLNIYKAPGYDLITAGILMELPDIGLSFLTQIFNACLQRNFVPPRWKVAEILLIPKLGKDPSDVKSHRPISLLPIPSKVLEMLVLSRMIPEIAVAKLIPEHQFGFRQAHGTIEQVHSGKNQLRL